jgi:hypothetical protein
MFSDGAAAKPGGLFGAGPPTTTTTAPAAAPTTAAATTSTTAPATTTTTTSAAGGLFGSGAPATSSAPAASTAAASTTADASKNPLGASTHGPPSQLSRLKNKTMDDVITRWASDLSRYQKDFKEQATQVSDWDVVLVGNGDKIQKLYLDTFEAERASHEIERQLQAVESQQDELEGWLDRYEAEVNDLFARQVGQAGDQLSGPDQERERTYKLAEKLTQHLDERSRDLAKMVQEINDVSGTLTKSNKTEDPVSGGGGAFGGVLPDLVLTRLFSSARLCACSTATSRSCSGLTPTRRRCRQRCRLRKSRMATWAATASPTTTRPRAFTGRTWGGGKWRGVMKVGVRGRTSMGNWGNARPGMVLVSTGWHWWGWGYSGHSYRGGKSSAMFMAELFYPFLAATL